MDQYICTSYNPGKNLAELSIGYMKNSSYLFITLGSITIILNTISIIAFFIGKKEKKRSK